MQLETKNCQNCKNDFVIESEDFNFYKKIKVPPPTFCPECRMIRRMVWRNVRSLYKRNCGLCDKSIISMYPDDGAPVYCNDCYFGDKWDPLAYGKIYDFSRPFFEQLKELWNGTPRFYLYRTGNLVNSDYSNFTVDNKNAYLAYSIIGCEDIMYSETVEKSKNCLDCVAVQKAENCSYNIDCEGNFNTHYAIGSRNCIDSIFIYDCVNCSNCCLSFNLRNQQYVFKNEKMTKEQYDKSVTELNLKKYSKFKEIFDDFSETIRNKAIHRFAFIFASQNAVGDYINHSRNVKRSFDVWSSENVSYGVRITENVKDCYDSIGIGRNGELIYESLAASVNTYRDFFCYISLESKECEYSFLLKNCSDCFGCVSLINAKYCIFNKQYSEKEYFEMVKKIKQHMMDMPFIDIKGRVYKYGEFFPYELSPFGYNETIANDYFPLLKSEAIEKSYFWKEKEKRDYQITKKSENLMDNILDVKEDILNEIISCPNNGNQMFQCTSAFKIVPSELQFYKKHNLPLPRYCPNCRHYQRLKYRNTMRLYERKCMKEGCTNKFETSYAPERPEIIYCERCYQQEVY